MSADVVEAGSESACSHCLEMLSFVSEESKLSIYQHSPTVLLEEFGHFILAPSWG